MFKQKQKNPHKNQKTNKKPKRSVNELKLENKQKNKQHVFYSLLHLIQLIYVHEFPHRYSQSFETDSGNLVKSQMSQLFKYLNIQISQDSRILTIFEKYVNPISQL